MVSLIRIYHLKGNKLMNNNLNEEVVVEAVSSFNLSKAKPVEPELIIRFRGEPLTNIQQLKNYLALEDIKKDADVVTFALQILTMGMNKNIRFTDPQTGQYEEINPWKP